MDRWPRFALWVLLLVVAYAGAWWGIANHDAARQRPATNTCPAIQKTLAAAVEMYNLDKNTRIQQPLLEGQGPRCTVIPAEVLEALQSAGYIQTIPLDPGMGSHPQKVYCFSNWGNGVFCLAHGDVSPDHESFTPARQQLKSRGVTEAGILAAAWDHPAPGWEGPLTWQWRLLIELAVVVLVGALSSSLLRRSDTSGE